jgi:hypothetical protein
MDAGPSFRGSLQVGADNEEAVGVERLARTDRAIPPTEATAGELPRILGASRPRALGGGVFA